jgi:hypothetical protein
VAESDTKIISEAIREVAKNGRLPPLTDDDVKLGQYSIAKVSMLYPKWTVTKYSPCSSIILERRY